jgi:hypothetical protein
MFLQSVAVIRNPTLETFERSLRSPKLWKVLLYLLFVNLLPFLVVVANKNITPWVLFLLPILLVASLILPSWLYYSISKKFSSHVSFVKVIYAKALYLLPLVALGVLGGVSSSLTTNYLDNYAGTNETLLRLLSASGYIAIFVFLIFLSRKSDDFRKGVLQVGAGLTPELTAKALEEIIDIYEVARIVGVVVILIIMVIVWGQFFLYR